MKKNARKTNPKFMRRRIIAVIVRYIPFNMYL